VVVSSGGRASPWPRHRHPASPSIAIESNELRTAAAARALLWRCAMKLPTTLLLALVTGAAPIAARAQAPDTTARAIVSALPLRSAIELRRAGARYAPVVRTCYEREGLLQDPALRGRLEIGFTVGPSGEVRDVAVDTLEVRGTGMGDVARCVAEQARHWHFSAGAFAPESILLPYELLPPERPVAAESIPVGPAVPPSPAPDTAAPTPPTRPR
jgi:hypothetical protein